MKRDVILSRSTHSPNQMLRLFLIHVVSDFCLVDWNSDGAILSNRHRTKSREQSPPFERSIKIFLERGKKGINSSNAQTD